MSDNLTVPVGQSITLSDGFIPSIKNNVKTKMPVIIISSLTFIAGLAWNNAFIALIDYYVPKEYVDKNNAWYKVLYAFTLTTVIIIAISMMLKFVEI